MQQGSFSCSSTLKPPEIMTFIYKQNGIYVTQEHSEAYAKYSEGVNTIGTL